MIGKTGQAALCALAVAMPMAAVAQDTQVDPLGTGQVLELSMGLFAPVDRLTSTLATPNGGGETVLPTSLLDFAAGGRVSFSYKDPLESSSRLVTTFTAADVEATERVEVGPRDLAFPGIFDDGYRLRANAYFDATIDTSMTTVSIGKEWTPDSNWQFSLGLQGGRASQDISTLLYGRTPVALFDGELFATIDSKSRNLFAGIYGGVSHYAPLGNGLGLRLSGNLGVLRNRFDFEYIYVNRSLFTLPDEVRVEGSDTSTAVSTKVSARLERQVSEGRLVSLEIGYEGLFGVGNGANTFLDPDGTSSSADIERDTIGAAYVSIGYAVRF